MEEHKVYHIRTKDNTDLTQGYIGITCNINQRIRQHRCAGRLTSDKELVLLCVGTKDYCLDMEYKLRPEPNMGDNQNSGGEYRTQYKRPNTIIEGRPSRATGKPPMTRFTKGQIPHNYGTGQSYILTSPDGEEFLVVSLCTFCKEYNLTPQNLRKVAKGERKYHKGWKARTVTIP